MVIQWLGHACFLIISEDGTKIITDPYTPNAFGGSLSYGSIHISPDIVTISHHHADHDYVEGLPGDFKVVSREGSETADGIHIKGVEVYHDPEEGSMRGPNIIFVMNVDHLRLCHLGDLGHELSMQQIEEIGEVDILFIPVGGYYTISSEQATSTVDRLNPRLVFPMHYKTDKTTLPIAPVDNFLQGKQNVRKLNTSEYEVTRETLPDQREIIVLKHAL